MDGAEWKAPVYIYSYIKINVSNYQGTDCLPIYGEI